MNTSHEGSEEANNSSNNTLKVASPNKITFYMDVDDYVVLCGSYGRNINNLHPNVCGAAKSLKATFYYDDQWEEALLIEWEIQYDGETTDEGEMEENDDETVW